MKMEKLRSFYHDFFLFWFRSVKPLNFKLSKFINEIVDFNNFELKHSKNIKLSAFFPFAPRKNNLFVLLLFSNVQNLFVFDKTKKFKCHYSLLRTKKKPLNASCCEIFILCFFALCFILYIVFRDHRTIKTYMQITKKKLLSPRNINIDLTAIKLA